MRRSRDGDRHRRHHRTASVDLTLPAITLAADGRTLDRVARLRRSPSPLAPDEITRRTAAAGVVGLGGATFPSAVKFSLGKRLEVTTLIVNGGECDPISPATTASCATFPTK